MVVPHHPLGALAIRSNFSVRGYIDIPLPIHLLTTHCHPVARVLAADSRADRTFTYRKSRLTLFMEVINATARDNYRPSSPGVNLNSRRVFEPMETTFPLLPVAGILIEF